METVVGIVNDSIEGLLSIGVGEGVVGGGAVEGGGAYGGAVMGGGGVSDGGAVSVTGGVSEGTPGLSIDSAVIVIGGDDIGD